MSRRLVIGLALLLLPAPLRAQPSALWQKLEENPALMAQEMRALLLEAPQLIDEVRSEARARMAADAASDLAAEVAGDSAMIAKLTPALFGATPRGFGAEGPAAITLFTAAGCAPCLRAETELRALADEIPGLRVELRSLSDDPADRLDRALQRREGPETAARFRARLQDPDNAQALAESLTEDPEALLALAESPEIRAELAQEVSLFRDLGLDMAPSYVMPGRLIRGEMPKVVLQSYLSP
ncbi:hypothetical protein SAMN06297129_2658 [Pseudooceanicola antarcticus]|uniref:Protein-disulfide isomerase n=1 Tax=Pseudooceanicola antarcticus TaxID=1247613 RepID=A0A285J1F2_9RHOB|nr:hypothetical protein [Pseudooceanicola antarcticus]SNY53893.1 hypothetical protein SAMN06297129_2658 [Pseudooceanicola antarcticus]